jgi:hypothetical protein
VIRKNSQTGLKIFFRGSLEGGKHSASTAVIADRSDILAVLIFTLTPASLPIYPGMIFPDFY